MRKREPEKERLKLQVNQRTMYPCLKVNVPNATERVCPTKTASVPPFTTDYGFGIEKVGEVVLGTKSWIIRLEERALEVSFEKLVERLPTINQLRNHD